MISGPYCFRFGHFQLMWWVGAYWCEFHKKRSTYPHSGWVWGIQAGPVELRRLE